MFKKSGTLCFNDKQELQWLQTYPLITPISINFLFLEASNPYIPVLQENLFVFESLHNI